MGEPSDQGEVSPVDEDIRHLVDLPLVGPATARVIEEAKFNAAEIVDGRVSYVMLREAGINPGVAARMRRRYSLVWSFRWRFGGSDLADRAAQVHGLRPPERAWIERSQRPVANGHDAEDAAWVAWIEASFAESAGHDPPDTCPRCGGPISTYVLEGQERIHCEGCGYAGIDIAHDD